MLRLPIWAFASVASLAVLGCGGDDDDDEPVDVAGVYTVALTNSSVSADSASCPFDAGSVGEMALGITFDIEQDGGDLTGTVSGGGSGIALAVVLGNADFEGSASGNGVSLVAYGTLSRNEGGCAYTLNATIAGSLSGDALAGTVTYTPNTNGSPDCDELDCSLVQEFSGSRAP